MNYRQFAYHVFYTLPHPVRNRIVRLIAPTYVLGAVTLVHSLDGEQLLLLRQPPGSRGWSLPGGLINRREDPVVCAARELREETGINLSISAFTPMTPNAVIHPGGWVDNVFTARVCPDTSLSLDPAEVIEAKWFPVHALPPLTHQTANLIGRYGLGPLAAQVL